MPIRIEQLIVDEDLSLKGFKLLNVGAFNFEAKPAGTLPLAGEVIRVDDVIAIKNLLVTDRAQLGDGNTDLINVMAFPFRMDSRTSQFTYDTQERIDTIRETDQALPVWIAQLSYDNYDRIAQVVEQTALGVVTSVVTYVGTTERFDKIERTVQ